MSTITSLVGTDGITTANSMTKINTNFTNLNTDKFEKTDVDTDTTLAANSDTKVPSQKATKAYVDAFISLPVSSESSTGTTHSLTTTTNQKVVVMAMGNLNDGAGVARTISLNYNAVAQHSVTITSGAAATNTSFSLIYTASHGAATQNVTVTTTGGTLQNVVIVVLKIRT